MVVWKKFPRLELGLWGNRQRLDALRPQPIQPGPQVFRIERIVGAERQLGYARAPEDDVAMQHAVRRRGVLVADESGESTRRIVAFGRLDGPLPRVSAFRLLPKSRIELAGVDGPIEDTVSVGELRVGHWVDRIVNRCDVAHILGVVGDGHEIQRRTAHADGLAGRMPQWGALRIRVSRIRPRACAEPVGVGRVLRVHVQVSEVDIPDRRFRACLDGEKRSRDREYPKCSSHHEPDSPCLRLAVVAFP